MPGVSSNNPLIRAINQAAAERGATPRGAPPIKTLVQTQATSVPAAPGVNNGQGATSQGVTAPTNPGVGANEDSGQNNQTQNTTNQNQGNQKDAVTGTLNPNAQNEQIIPRGNVLDSFSSYTYRASVYMMSPQQYAALQVSNKKIINGYQLLFQSGGAPQNTGGFQGGLNTSNTYYENDGTSSSANGIPGPTGPDAGRNPAFPQDFYIDSLSIENIIARKATGAAHAAAVIKFSVIEPQNITLLNRLWEAAQDYAPTNFGGTAINYNAVTYLLVLRFYGYDENGNLVKGIAGADPSQGLTDPNSVIEKLIPFKITKLNWAVTGKNVQYDFEAAPLPLIVNAGTRRGTVPYDVQLNNTTLDGLLSGKAVYNGPSGTATTTGANVTAQTALRTGVNLSNTAAGGGRGGPSSYVPPPLKANSAPSVKDSISQGLMAAMNEFQAELVKRQIYEVPDTYEVVWASGSDSIKNASILIPGTKQDRAQSGMAKPATQDAANLSETKVSTDKTVRNFSIPAGTQLVQVIDQAIRNSTYITEQALVSWVEDHEELNPEKVNKPVTWYNITFKAIPKQPYDKLRNDYAYHIQYIISPWRIENFNSKYFPLNEFRGVHKSYPYWFTGKNTSVIDFAERMDTLYHITVSGSDPKNSAAEKQRREATSNLQEMIFYSYQSSSTESRQGAQGKSFETSASISESLYSPSDQARATLKIIGDPAWIQQGSIAANINPENFNYNVFLPDGTINFDAGQVMFEIAWQRPEDYDLYTGQADPYGGKARQPLQSRVYEALKITSEFKQGKFEQIVEGGLYPFIKPKRPTNKAVGAAASTTSPDAIRPEQPTSGTRPTATTPTQVANGDYPATGDSPLLPTGTMPAPTKENSMVVSRTGSATPAVGPDLQPQDPPAPPTSGSGENIEYKENTPPPAIGRVTLEGLAPAPTEPQDMVRDA